MGEYQLENLDFKTCQHICDCYSGRVGNNLSFLFATAGRVDLCISCRKFMSRTFFAQSTWDKALVFFRHTSAQNVGVPVPYVWATTAAVFRAEILVMKPILVVWENIALVISRMYREVSPGVFPAF